MPCISKLATFLLRTCSSRLMPELIVPRSAEVINGFFQGRKVQKPPAMMVGGFSVTSESYFAAATAAVASTIPAPHPLQVPGKLRAVEVRMLLT